MALRLGFDAARALRNPTGLGSYARGVLRGLADLGGNQLHLYSRRPPQPAFEQLHRELGATLHLPPPGWRTAGLRDWWRTFQLGRTAATDGVELYHGLTQELPRDIHRAGIPAVVTVADLLYLTHPHLFPAIDRASYRWRYRWSALNAGAVIAISSHTRNEVNRHFGVPLERIVVIPPAVDRAFADEIDFDRLAAARQRLELSRNYFIAVATLEARKRQVAAVRALAAPALRDATLLLVGGDGGSRAALEAEATALDVGHRVR
ncbi:MAG TPA: glycosyltransferase, partial [Gemmatimonadales bacterium]|nr:glycosyltransferase [Gemmatimonadales bacterium]